MNDAYRPQRQSVRRLAVCGLGCLLAVSLHAQNLIEYFWDTDPGIGRATIVKGQGDEQVDCQIPTDGLSGGAHMLGIRALNGKYASPTVLRVVYKSTPMTGGGRVEYFWDADPGIGRATVLPADLSGDASTVGFTLPTDGLAAGVHLLGVRAGNNAGWSPTCSQMVAIAPQGGRVDCVEYFWDDDPGIGKATRYAVTDGSGGEVLVSMDVLTDTLSCGVHMLGIRSHSGAWSPTLRRAVIIGSDNNPIETVEYFWDEDPGFGLATPLPFTGTDTAVVNTDIATPDDYGSHTLIIRARAGGRWGTSLVQTICVNATPDFSLPADTVCRGESITVRNMTRGATGQTTYSWDMDGDGKADATDSADFAYTYAKAGEYMVSLAVKTVGDCETTCTKPVVVLDTAEPSVSLSASARTGCSGDTLRFVATPRNAGSRPEYEWTVNGEVVQGTTGDTLLLSTLSDRDNVRVTVLSSNPCSQVNAATSSPIAVTINASPEVSAAPMFPVYTSENSFNLSGGVPDGGTYFIDGREASLFDPQANAPGTHTMTYRYTAPNGCGSEAVQTFELREPGEGSLLPGDVNKDEWVDIMDILCTVDYIYGRIFPAWNTLTADINSDGSINVADIVGIAGIILGDDAPAHPAARSAAGKNDDLTIAAADADAGNATEVYIDFTLRGTDRPCGVQFDVTMPEGVGLEPATGGLTVGRKAGSSANTYTLLAYSTDLQPLGGTLGVKAVLPVNMAAGTYPIVPENVVAVAGDMRAIGHAVAPGRLTIGSATGMRGVVDGRPGIIVEREGLRVLNAGGGSITVYDAGGRFAVGSTLAGDNELVTVAALVRGTYVAEITKGGMTVRTKFIWKN